MQTQKKATLMINVVGGAAVLGSYVHGLATHPTTRDQLWGALPPEVQPLYTATMLLAAVGYFPFTYYLLFRTDPDRMLIAGRFRYGLVNLLYALALFPSALWMPLTFAYIAQPSPILWLLTRAALATVGLASLGLLGALLTLRPRESGLAHRLAVAGAAAFCVQTALLDAIIWPAFFQPNG